MKPLTNGYSTQTPTSFLALPEPHKSSKSLTDLSTLQITLPSDDSKSLNNLISQSSEKRKKSSKLPKFIKSLVKKKPKNAIMLEN